MTKLSWRKGIGADTQIAPGTPLATAFWEDGVKETLTAPPGCHGTIHVTNRKLILLKLPSAPSQLLLRLKP
jgi:hypothetical protein